MNFNTRQDMDFAFNSKGEGASVTTHTPEAQQNTTTPSYMAKVSSNRLSFINNNSNNKLENSNYITQHAGKKQDRIRNKNQKHNDIQNITTTTSNSEVNNNNALEPENEDVASLNRKLHEPHSNKKKDPNTYNSLLEVGAGFSEQKRLIDDLIARTKEDIQQQQNVIENKLHKKRKYKEICDIIYATVAQNNKDSTKMRSLLQLHDDDDNDETLSTTNIKKKETKGADCDNASNKENTSNTKSNTERIDESDDLENEKSMSRPCSDEHADKIAVSP